MVIVALLLLTFGALLLLTKRSNAGARKEAEVTAAELRVLVLFSNALVRILLMDDARFLGKGNTADGAGAHAEARKKLATLKKQGWLPIRVEEYARRPIKSAARIISVMRGTSNLFYG